MINGLRLRLFEAKVDDPKEWKFDPSQMHYIYILESLSKNGERYIGRTSDLRRRMMEHNDGKCPSTAKYKPWKLKQYFAFDDPDTCARFERYLKSGSGHAFAKRHL